MNIQEILQTINTDDVNGIIRKLKEMQKVEKERKQKEIERRRETLQELLEQAGLTIDELRILNAQTRTNRTLTLKKAVYFKHNGEQVVHDSYTKFFIDNGFDFNPQNPIGYNGRRDCNLRYITGTNRQSKINFLKSCGVVKVVYHYTDGSSFVIDL